MQRDHTRLHRSLAVLGPPRRFQLMLLLLSGVERSVSQLARAVHLSQSCTTRHLQALERAGLVKGTRDGKRVVFRPAPRDAAARGVIASLARGAEDAVLLAGIAAGAIPVASTLDRDPIMDTDSEGESPVRRVSRPRTAARPEPASRDRRPGATLEVAPPPGDAVTERAITPAQGDNPHARMESGNTSGPDVAHRRHASDIEDFLL